MPYVFGDSEPAARRLELVHQVFSPATRAFLAEHAAAAPDLAVDLGCGPGVCTRFVREVTRARLVAGLDASARFVALANRFADARLRFFLHDVTKVPFPVGPSDLLYCRLLLTHLSDPQAVLTRWATQLRPGGRLLIEEVERIMTERELFQRYLNLVADLLAENGNQLYIGPMLHGLHRVEGLARVASAVRPLAVESSRAAAMFRLNFQTWKTHPVVQSHYREDELQEMERELEQVAGQPGDRHDTEWGIRQLVYERVPE